MLDPHLDSLENELATGDKSPEEVTARAVLHLADQLLAALPDLKDSLSQMQDTLDAMRVKQDELHAEVDRITHHVSEIDKQTFELTIK
jgi:hypothetical protein